MTKSSMQGHQNEEVHRFQHLEAWIVVIVYVYLDHRNEYNDVHQQEAFQKIMPNH